MSLTPQFTKAYQQLNPAQKQAVDNTDGPVIVSAGPGTGKTQVLAMRIANILRQTDTPPSAILALTFTDSASKNMRQRLVELIGQPAYYVKINTFHSFCQGVIQDHADYFLIDEQAEAIGEIERYQLVQHLVSDLPLKQLRPLNAPYFYVKELMRAISDLKREGVDLDQYQKLINWEKDHLEELKSASKPSKTAISKQEKLVIKNEDLYLIYQAYQQQLQALGRYDFDDMINLVRLAFAKHEDLLLEYQENLLYFLVDEYQDTNSSQNQVLLQLALAWQDKANIFVVGDPNQAIYRFQGASIENMLQFLKHYPNALQINLETGYRCGQEIYNQAQQLISHNYQTDQLTSQSLVQDNTKQLFTYLNQPLQSISLYHSQLKLYQAPSQTVEAVQIAKQIRTLLDDGQPASNIAVLYRNNQDALLLSQVLAKYQIPFAIEGGDNVLEEDHIVELINLLRAVLAVRLGSEMGLFYELLQYAWLKKDGLNVMKLARIAGKCNLSIYELLEQGYEQTQLLIAQKKLAVDLSLADWQPLADFFKQIVAWNQLDAQLPFTAWFEEIIHQSGYLDWILEKQDKAPLLSSLNALYSQVKSLVYQNKQFKLANFIEALDTMQLHNIGISNQEFSFSSNCVTLSTAHKAKGREWQEVFIYNLIDGKWGRKRKADHVPLPSGILTYTNSSTQESYEDDRRLFYVALTRAKKNVYLSYPNTIVQNNYTKQTIASVFLHEIGNLQTITDPELENNQAEICQQLLSTVKQPKPIDDKQQAFLQNLVDNFTLSVTGLNTYLRDSQEFLNNFILRVPRAKAPFMAFGSAIHFALEKMYQPLLSNDEILPLSAVLAEFEIALKKEILSQTEFEKRLQHGQIILPQYYQHYVLNQRSKPEPIMLEKNFGKGNHKIMMDNIGLSGIVDRIDWLDKNKRTGVVIDYKTGSSKTINQIEGKVGISDYSERELALPESIRGAYKRQLLFYKLLAELDGSFQPKITKGIFDFVEPKKDSKQFVRREFVLEDKDVDLLKELIVQVMKEIRSLEFLG